MPLPTNVEPVPLEIAYRLLNHGPSVLVSAQSQEDMNLMSAAWVCALDFSPPKVSIVLDKATYTRSIVEKSGVFILHLPSTAQAELVHQVGTESRHIAHNKMDNKAIQWYQPLVEKEYQLVNNCLGWLVCKVIPEPHIQNTYDLFVAEVIHAWADSRVFQNGMWQFENAPPEMRTIHYISGGKFYTVGEAITVATNN